MSLKVNDDPWKEDPGTPAKIEKDPTASFRVSGTCGFLSLPVGKRSDDSSIRTLTKISEALHVPLTSFFDDKPVLEAKDRCPVSLSGHCILDHLFVGQGRRPEANLESYSPQQLEILRACNFLLHKGDKEIVKMLSLLMKSLTKTGRLKSKLR